MKMWSKLKCDRSFMSKISLSGNLMRTRNRVVGPLNFLTKFISGEVMQTPGVRVGLGSLEVPGMVFASFLHFPNSKADRTTSGTLHWAETLRGLNCIKALPETRFFEKYNHGRFEFSKRGSHPEQETQGVRRTSYTWGQVRGQSWYKSKAEKVEVVGKK